jgi:hypothetical protein
MNRTVTALFDDMTTAQRAVQDLVDAGFPRDNISLVANDASGTYRSTVDRTDDVRGDEGAGFGAVAGALIGLGAMLIPGIGPVVAAGPLVAALTGAGVGAAAGALTGGITASLVDFGLTEETAGHYAEGVRRGGTLLVIHADETRAGQAETILNHYGTVDVQSRAAEWRNSGWTGFDESSTPYTTDEIEAERTRYMNN